MSKIRFLYCGGCGLVRQIRSSSYISSNVYDRCDVTFTRVSMTESEFEQYEHLMVRYGLIEFMRMYNNGEIDE